VLSGRRAEKADLPLGRSVGFSPHTTWSVGRSERLVVKSQRPAAAALVLVARSSMDWKS